ncbi:MAG TPA: SIS domain-containing protein, partial [Acidimicrobiales bacterium]|nr:SIS domain-containing protein [Acidimicrobiales bacterium]
MSRTPGSDLGLPALDSLGMLEATAGLADQVATAAAAGAGVTGLPVREQIENVVVLGMGGSGVAGDVLVGVAGPYLPVPVTVVKSYLPPAFVGPASLVFAVSFSGDTEETVEAAEEALAQQGRLVVVTGGGRLEEMARRAEAPLVRVPRDV